MNRILSIAAAICAVALVASGCTSSSGGTGAGANTAADVAADTAAGAGADAAASSDAAKTDTAAATADAAADTAKPDVVTKDVPPAPLKCDPSDGACLQGCGNSACATPSGACAKDPKCTKLGSCLTACEKSTDLPKDVTEATCGKKCITEAGDAATKAFFDSQACLGEKCITCKPKDQNCEIACASTLCIEQFTGCQADTSCTLVLACANTNKCQDQACLQACLTKYPDGQSGFMGLLQCIQTNVNACD